MLVNIFKSNNRILGILIVVICAVLRSPLLFAEVFGATDSIFNSPVVDYIIGVLLVSGMGLYFNFIVQKHKLLPGFNYLPALVVVVLNSLLGDLLVLTKVHFAVAFLLVAFHQLLEVYNKDNASANVFNLGLFLGLAITTYGPILVLLPVFVFGISYLKPVKLKEQFVLLIGLLVPTVYWVSYLFVSDQFDLGVLSIMEQPFFEYSQISLTSKYLVLYIVDLLSVVALIKVALYLRSEVVKTRKIVITTVVLMFSGTFSILLNQFDYLSFFLISVPSCGLLMAILFYEIKRAWMAELLLFFLIGGSVAGYFL